MKNKTLLTILTLTLVILCSTGSIFIYAGDTTLNEQAIFNRVYNGDYQALNVSLSGLNPGGADLPLEHIWIGDTVGKATDTIISGDITISSGGVAAIGSTKVTNAMLAGSIAPSKITGTAAVLGGNSFSGPIYVVSGANISSVTATGINTPALVSDTSIQGATITGVTYISGGYVLANAYLQLTGATQDVILASTPTAVGQIKFCNDCTLTPMVISTGTARCDDWSGVGSIALPD